MDFNTHNQEASTQHGGLHANIQIQRKSDAEEIGIGKHFSRKSTPLLGNFSHLITIQRDNLIGPRINQKLSLPIPTKNQTIFYLELNVTAQRKRTKWPLDAEYHFAGGIFDSKRWTAYRPLLFNRTDMAARRCRHFHGLQTAWKAAFVAGQRTVQANDGIFVCVHNFHFEWTRRSATISRTTIVILHGPINFLSQTVFYRKFVVGLETRKRFE